MASLPADNQSTVVRTPKELSRASTMELTDSEVTKVFQEIVRIQRRYASRRNTHQNLEALRDEVLTRLMEMNILATFDPAPCLQGLPPEVEIIGKVGQEAEQHGFDHEKQQWEVRKATGRGEDYYGEKEKAS